MRSTLTLLFALSLTMVGRSQATLHRPAERAAAIDPAPLAPLWHPAHAHKPQQGAPKSTTVIPLGEAANMYTCLLSGQNQVAYDPVINTVIFQHRQDPANHAGLGGVGTLRVDYSTDGGTTWSLDTLLITPNMFAGTAGDATGTRYPSCALYNPTGNTDPDNAFVVGNGPCLSATTATWGLLFQASTRLDGSFATDTYVDQWGDLTSFHPYGLVVNPNGDAWSLSTRYYATGDTNNYASFQVNKGVFNAGTNSWDWSVQQTISPDYFPDNDGSAIYSAHNLAFSPDGQTGYAVIVGKENDGIPTGPYPLIWKSTDAGATWNQLPNHDFSQEQEMIDWIAGASDTGLPRPYFSDFDCVVDGGGTLHIFSEVLSGYIASPDSQGYVYTDITTQFLYHCAVSSGQTWAVKKIADMYGTDYSIPSSDPLNIPIQSNRPQASRTANGAVVFFTWNSSGPNETENFLPDVYARGFDVTNQTYTAEKNLTIGTDAEGFSWFQTMSVVSITGGAEFDYELPIVYVDHNGDALGPANFYYLKGVGFNTDEFVGITEHDLGGHVQVYPNPGDGLFTVELDALGQVELSVTDVTGRDVLGLRTSRVQQLIDLGAEPAGVYLLSVQGSTGKATKRLLKR